MRSLYTNLSHYLWTGSPVLGYLAAGVLIGPYALSIIRNVHGTKAIGEFGVVFLLFNIGLEVRINCLGMRFYNCHLICVVFSLIIVNIVIFV